nr:hypothetical protein [Tanacetum cinerariifolium]
MDLFAFIRHSDPTKVRIGERELAEHEVKLLKMTEGRTVPLSPPVTTALEDHAVLGDSGDSIDKLFDDANQEHSLPPTTSGVSFAALLDMIPKGSDLPSGVMEPLIAASVASMPDATFFVSFLVADASVVKVAVTTTIDADVAAGSKAKDVSKDFDNIRDSTSVGGVNADAASILRLKKTFASSNSFYASQSLETETMHRVYIPRWKVCLGVEVRMWTEHTLERKGELEDKCVKHTTLLLERDAEIAHLKSLLSLKETEAAEAISLQSQLFVMETTDAAKSTELRDLKEKNFAFYGERNALSEMVTALESVTTSKVAELASLSSQVAKLTADLSGFQLLRDEVDSKVASLKSERDCLATQKSSLESAFELFRECIEALQDEQAKALCDRVTELDAELSEMAIHLDEEFYPCFLTTISERRCTSAAPINTLSTTFASSAVIPPSSIVNDQVLDTKSLSEDPLAMTFDKEKECIEALQDEQAKALCDRVTELDAELSEMAIHLDEEFYPCFLTTISERRCTSAAPINTLSTTFASSAVIPPSSIVNDQVLDAKSLSEDPLAMTFDKEKLGTSLE